MKQNILYLAFLTLLATSFCLSCDSSSSEDKKRIAELEAQISELNSGSYKTGTSDDNTSIERGTESKNQEFNIPENKIAGVYQFKDKNNDVWVMEVNSDNTLIMYNKQAPNKKYYGSWEKYSFEDYVSITMDINDHPYVYFESGKESLFMQVFTDKWIYSDYRAIKSKNPNKRLPIKKIK